MAGTTAGDQGDWLDIAFSTQPDVTYRYFRSQAEDDLELAYALTVHKAEGSDFDFVFFPVPQAGATLSRELVCTTLARFRKKLVLLIEGDTARWRRSAGWKHRPRFCATPTCSRWPSGPSRSSLITPLT